MHDGYGVGLVFDLINDIISTIVLFGSTILKNIHTYLSEIDYNSIGFDIINKYSTMKQTVVSTYNNNIDKNSILNISLEYSLYFIEYVKSFIYDYRTGVVVEFINSANCRSSWNICATATWVKIICCV
jgi:hypothetical protein